MNEKRDELIDWLLSSRDGEKAVAPFTTIIAMQEKYERLHGIMRLWQGATFRNWTIHLDGHGSIEFVNVNQGVNFLNGRTWDHAFELQGPRQYKGYAEYDFMKTLLRRIEPKWVHSV